MQPRDILDLALQYVKVSGEGQMKVLLMVCEWAKVMHPEAIARKLEHMIENYDTIWKIEVGRTCYTIKETGDIVETTYLDNEYFRKVRKMGNLTLTKKEAEERVEERMNRTV